MTSTFLILLCLLTLLQRFKLQSNRIFLGLLYRPPDVVAVVAVMRILEEELVAESVNASAFRPGISKEVILRWQSGRTVMNAIRLLEEELVAESVDASAVYLGICLGVSQRNASGRSVIFVERYTEEEDVQDPGPLILSRRIPIARGPEDTEDAPLQEEEGRAILPEDVEILEDV
ncbi:hypothetical protein CAEBREN_12143 [Caenorhabditis brenneri]|uniref:HORMA domain-containing protein n=1 Tax=Caenorhabditis brenneri TaxID=135651 RepID=G0NE45_CAEBE|nr:hypothetical protein CAEBREN_12143 [Caenorhabditis brenneri]